MPRGDKFLELTRYLENSGNNQVKFSFGEIERIIGFKLCKSAYSYAEYWSNAESHSIFFAWNNAGYAF